MGKTIRFGVSLDSDLLDKFDRHCEENSYQTRSEAIRDLIRNTLVKNEWTDENHEVAGTLTLVYDHHQSNLSQRLTELQHEAHHLIMSSLHVHLDHFNCLEVLVLRGTAGEIRNLGQRLVSTKGVKHGKLSLTTTGQDLV
ncbi:nickel-responsive transcriptional regulator NikR [Desulfobaculum bizertense]|uniref:Putative nickel-responsive regulator n=1 Tax=Desulfobaculum bizertense DSM 18034 TaxID=1121442 RepID=A0A1T4W6Y3_9BACT|nr:nickel-responsive transcriptional regulator NikR [Desulfobaculum bizertense]UIJ39066.1 nickel-responsive transcriptional regulator NikR [Desulfobaculum bizertense]SKA72947.1 transcriptional regulator, CopG family [Desulfobaculum bizertense DSM 18034]